MRHARAVMHAGIARPQMRGKGSRYSWRMPKPISDVCGKRPIHQARIYRNFVECGASTIVSMISNLGRGAISSTPEKTRVRSRCQEYLSWMGQLYCRWKFVGIIKSIGDFMVWGSKMNILYEQFYTEKLWKTFQPYKCSSIRKEKITPSFHVAIIGFATHSYILILHSQVHGELFHAIFRLFRAVMVELWYLFPHG